MKWNIRKVARFFIHAIDEDSIKDWQKNESCYYRNTTDSVCGKLSEMKLSKYELFSKAVMPWYMYFLSYTEQKNLERKSIWKLTVCQRLTFIKVLRISKERKRIGFFTCTYYFHCIPTFVKSKICHKVRVLNTFTILFIT